MKMERFKNWKLPVLVFCLLFIASFAVAQTLPNYQKMYPASDVNKAGVPPAAAPGDNSCWLATASNMLAGAGYGNGSTLQARANDIYSDFVAHYGIAGGGWIDDGLNWWLSSANNVWPDNPYDSVIMVGNYTKIPLDDSDLPKIIANELRSCQFVGLSISWDSAGTVPGSGGHAITCWGDNSTSSNPLAVNPTQVIVTDSDSGVGEQTYNYTWQTYTYGAGTTNGWEMSYGGTPFIKHYTTLCAQPNGYIARGTRTIHQSSDTPATDLHFKAYQKESWVNILSYRQTIDQPYGNVSVTEDDYPQTDGQRHSIMVDYTGMNVPYCTWVTIDVEFILNSWNTVRFEDVYFTYPGGVDYPPTNYIPYPNAIKAVPDIGWQVVGIPRVTSSRLTDVYNQGNVNQLASSNNQSTINQNGLYDADGIIPERGFVVAQYDILNSAGELIAIDKLEHEFDEKVEFKTHYLTVFNDDKQGETVYIKNVKYGFSEGYLTKNQLKSFNNWTNEIQGTKELKAGQQLDLSLNIYPAPEVTTIDPAEANQGETLNVTISGNNFAAESTIQFSGNGVSVNSQTLVSATELTAEIKIAGNAETGKRHLLVINPGNRIGILHNALEIKPKPSTPPSVTPTTPAFPRFPLTSGLYNYSPQTYYQSPPTYNNFNYSPVKNIGLPGLGMFSLGSAFSLSQTSYSLPTSGYNLGSFLNQSPFVAVNPYNTLSWNFGSSGQYSTLPIFTLPVLTSQSAMSPSNIDIKWDYVSYDTSSVIGNSPHIGNFTFGADYDRVNITINNNMSYILNY